MRNILLYGDTAADLYANAVALWPKELVDSIALWASGKMVILCRRSRSLYKEGMELE